VRAGGGEESPVVLLPPLVGSGQARLRRSWTLLRRLDTTDEAPALESSMKIIGRKHLAHLRKLVFP
jgi:hypothetical protein